MPSHDTNVRYMTYRICRIRQDSARIFTYSSAANRRDDFQNLHGSIGEQKEQYATVCKNVNVGRRFSSKRRRYRFFCPLGRYIFEDLHVPLPHTGLLTHIYLL